MFFIKLPIHTILTIFWTNEHPWNTSYFELQGTVLFSGSDVSVFHGFNKRKVPLRTGGNRYESKIPNVHTTYTYIYGIYIYGIYIYIWYIYMVYIYIYVSIIYIVYIYIYDIIYDIWYMTYDTWYMIHDMWYMIYIYIHIFIYIYIYTHTHLVGFSHILYLLISIYVLSSDMIPSEHRSLT